MLGPTTWDAQRFVQRSHWPGAQDVEIHVRTTGSGEPILFLHGGWGYEAYPIDRQVAAIPGLRWIVPDRAGYGRSTRITEQPKDFHRRAARETIDLLDALGLETAALWGHSDGAVIAAWMALLAPQRFPNILLESLHLWRAKPHSRSFFESCADGSLALGDRIKQALLADHGPRWMDVIRMNGRTWVDLGRSAVSEHEDLFEGRLGAVRSRVLFLHGSLDPRTEPGELDTAREAIRDSVALIVPGKHAPHAEDTAWTAAQEQVARFLSAR